MDVSVKVMWKFAEQQLQRHSAYLPWWWRNRSSQHYDLEDETSWVYDAIFNYEPDKWDISVCFTAISECKDMRLEDGPYHNNRIASICTPGNKRSALCCLKDMRNYLFHERPLEVSEEDYVLYVEDSKRCYEILLDREADLEEFYQQLDDIKKCESIVL